MSEHINDLRSRYINKVRAVEGEGLFDMRGENRINTENTAFLVDPHSIDTSALLSAAYGEGLNEMVLDYPRYDPGISYQNVDSYNVSGDYVKTGAPMQVEVTAYDLGFRSCEKLKTHSQYGRTASGMSLVGKSREQAMVVAAPPAYEIGTKLYFEFSAHRSEFNGIYTVQDRGGAIKTIEGEDGTTHIFDLFVGNDKDQGWENGWEDNPDSPNVSADAKWFGRDKEAKIYRVEERATPHVQRHRGEGMIIPSSFEADISQFQKTGKIKLPAMSRKNYCLMCMEDIKKGGLNQAVYQPIDTSKFIVGGGSPNKQWIRKDMHFYLEVLHRNVVSTLNGRPTKLQINSGYRTPFYNKSVNGAAYSMHQGCCAVDLHATNFNDRVKIADAAYYMGFGGIAVGKSFTHVDIGPEARWSYGIDFKYISPNRSNR